MSKGSLFIISAPSGTGKTTILKRILRTVAGISFSISHTTRPARKGEQDGVDYYFVSRDQFLSMQQQGTFLESAEVHGNLYGTSGTEIDKSITAGHDIILDIDTQGASQIRSIPSLEAVFIFIAPPSRQELEKRLSGRRTDSRETIALRLENARREMENIGFYDYVLVNDRIEDAVEMLRAIILAERSRNRRSLNGLPLPLPLFSDNEKTQTPQ